MQIIVGTGGKDLLPFTVFPARTAFRDSTHFGVLFLTLSPARADWEWRGTDGAVLDSGGDWCHHPEAAFAASPAPVSGTDVRFDADASTDHFGKALTAYTWDFGDGAIASGPQAAHTYAAPGDYPVTLTVTNARGLKGRAQRTVSGPVAPAAGCAGRPRRRRPRHRRPRPIPHRRRRPPRPRPTRHRLPPSPR